MNERERERERNERERDSVHGNEHRPVEMSTP
jgi:hypothetical protein